MVLPTNIDTTYADRINPGDKTHQQHHDEIHTILNALPADVAGEADLARSKNLSGQVKANYTGLSLTGFTANVPKVFNLSAAATVTLSASPTTEWPYGSGTSYDPDFFDSANTRLKENLVNGQVHFWRVIGSYANKQGGTEGPLAIELFNPVSGFAVRDDGAALFTGPIAAGKWASLLVTIADGASIPAGQGYRLQAITAQADATLQVSIESITRISVSNENVVVP